MAIADLFGASEQGGWYDPSDLSTLWKDTAGTSAVTADGDAVARIDDKSGNGNHLIQSTAAARPLYRTDGTLHWLEFDGTDDFLITSAAMDMSTTDQVTHAMAVETEASGVNTFGQLGGANSAGEFGLTTNSSSQLSSIVRGSAATSALWVLSDIGLTQKNVFVQLGDISADTNQIRVDGVQVIENTGNLGTGNMASASTYAFSASPNFFTGKLYQLVVRGVLTSGTTLTTLEDDLRTDAGHTFTYTSDQMYVEVFDGAMNVHTPVANDNYITWRIEDYDTSANPYGGGLGSVWEDCYWVERSGNTFGRIYRLTDTGLNEFAMKKDDGSDDNIGHDVHGGMARRASPTLTVDGVTKTIGTRADFTASSSVVLTEFFECYDLLDGTTVIANLDTTKTWEDGRLKLNQSITFLSAEDMLTCYLCMFSLYREFDNVDSNGYIVERAFMPDYSYDEYTPGSGVNATYPDAHHFKTITNHANGLAWEIEVQGSVPSEFRSWLQTGSSSRKFYLSILGQRDSFGILAERTPYTTSVNENFTMETWLTPSVGANVNTNKLWKGAVQPAETSPTGNEIRLWKGAVEPAAPTASSAADALIGGVTRSVTRGLTRGVTEGWSWGT